MAIEQLREDDFYLERCKDLFIIMKNMVQSKVPVDLITLDARLETVRREDLRELVDDVSSNFGTIENCEGYIELLAQEGVKRRLIIVSNEIQRMCYGYDSEFQEIVTNSENLIQGATTRACSSNESGMTEVMSKTVDRMNDIHRGVVYGVTTGFQKLDEEMCGFEPGHLIFVAGRPSMGKCHTKNTPILMFDGSVKMVQDVVVGDRLMGPDSKPRIVLSLATGVEKTYIVKQAYGIDYGVNESHMLSLKRSRNGKGKNPKVKHGDVLDISVKEYLGKSDKFKNNFKGYKVGVEFEERDVTLEPYFIGLWIGDGTSENAVITKPDIEIYEYLSSYAKRIGCVVASHKYEGKCQQYNIKGNNGYIVKGLKGLNLINNKHIPNNYLINSEINRLELLAGLLDSDGYYDKCREGYEITQKDKNLAYQIKFLADTLGFRTTINKKIGSISSIGFKGLYYKVLISGDVWRIPLRIKRKISNIITNKKDWTMSKISIVENGYNQYFGFVIDGDHRYLLGDCTVTHNTALVTAMALNMAINHQIPVSFFSLETTKVELGLRMLSQWSEVNLLQLRKGVLPTRFLPQVYEKTGVLADAPIQIDDNSGLTIGDLRSKLRKHKSKYGTRICFIDYLQLMSGSKKNYHAKRDEVVELSRGLKATAKDLKIPIVVLSQLSRESEKRGNKGRKPILSDLKESGSIEEDAEVVLFVHREWYYDKEKGDENKAEIIIAKQKNGPTDTVELYFKRDCAMFYNDRPEQW